MGLFGVTNKQLEELRTTYKKGMIIQLDYMDDPHAPPIGTKGKVENVDDAGTIHVHWDNGSGLGLIPYEGDKFHVVEKEKVLADSFIEQIKKEISINTFKNIKNIHKEEYIEGTCINSIWSYNATSVPMIIDIKESNLEIEGEQQYLESWIYFLKEVGNINNELDYEHYDGCCIIGYDELQKIDYDTFIKAIYNNANEYLADYIKQNSKLEQQENDMEIEM